METGDRLLTLEEVAERLRFKGKPYNQVRKVKRLIAAGKLLSVVKVFDNHVLVTERELAQTIRILATEGVGPQNRIPRLRPRKKA